MSQLTPDEIREIDRAIARCGHDVRDADRDAAYREVAAERPPDLAQWVAQRFDPNRPIIRMSDVDKRALAERIGPRAYTERLRAELRGQSVGDGRPPSAPVPEHRAVFAMSDGERQAWIDKHGPKAYRKALFEQLRGMPVDLTKGRR